MELPEQQVRPAQRERMALMGQPDRRVLPEQPEQLAQAQLERLEQQEHRGTRVTPVP